MAWKCTFLSSLLHSVDAVDEEMQDSEKDRETGKRILGSTRRSFAYDLVAASELHYLDPPCKFCTVCLDSFLYDKSLNVEVVPRGRRCQPKPSLPDNCW